MSEDVEFKLLFFLVTFTDDGHAFFVPTDEIDEPEMAECMIPYEKDGVSYGITCYVTNYPNAQPIIGEMMLLKEFFAVNGIPGGE